MDAIALKHFDKMFIKNYLIQIIKFKSVDKSTFLIENRPRENCSVKFQLYFPDSSWSSA